MHEEGRLKPTEDGIALSKDVWMAGIALSLLMDGITNSKGRKKKAKKAKPSS